MIAGVIKECNVGWRLATVWADREGTVLECVCFRTKQEKLCLFTPSADSTTG